MKTLKDLESVLNENKIDYKLHELPEGTPHTVEGHIQAMQDIGLSDTCATLVMQAGEELVVLLRRGDTKIHNKALRKAVGSNKMRFLNGDELLEKTGLQPGIVTPFLLPEGIRILIDEKVLEKQRYYVGSASFEHMLEVDLKHILGFTKAEKVDVTKVNEERINALSAKKRILTGDRPTGKLHLGHYVGSLANRSKLQHEYDTFVMVADVQALTDNFDNPQKVRDNTFQVVQDNIAAGLDPEKVTFFIQSQIPQIAELTIFFMNLVRHSEVLRNPTVKDEIKQKNFGESVPFGFVAYPVSQAADIHIVRADLVPVGKDQAPMLELADTIGKRFNKTYKTQVFNKIEPKFGEIGRLVGTDGNAKMSKSIGNTIYLMDDDKTIKEKVKGMYTDPNRVRATDPGTVEGNPVFIYHDAFNDNLQEVEDLKLRYKAGKVGDVEVKDKLSSAIIRFLTPMRERRAQYPIEMVQQIVMDGTNKVLKEADETMQKVKEAMKINF